MTSAPSPTAAKSPTAELFSAPHRRISVGILLLLATNAFEIIGSATAMPAVLEDLGGRGQYGWAIAAPTIGSVFGASLGGVLADRLGDRRTLFIGLTLFVAGIIAIGTASTMGAVTVGRLGMGVGSGISFTLELVLIARYLPAHLTPTAIATSATVFVLPGLVGPTIVAATIAAGGWRWVFFGILPPVAACLVMLEPELRRRRPINPAPPDPGALDAGPSTPAASPAVSESGRPWWGPALLTFGLAVAVVAASSSGIPATVIAIIAVGLVVVGATTSLPAGTFTFRPGLPAAVSCTLLACAGYLTVEAYLPLLLREVRGQSLFLAGLPLTVAAIFWTGGAWLQSRVTAERRRRASQAGSALGAAGIGIVAAAIAPATPIVLVYAGTALASFGCGLVVSLAQQIALEQAEPGEEGAASAAVQLATLLGIAAGTSIVGVLVARVDDLELVLTITLIGAALLAGLGMWPSSRLPLSGRRAGAERDSN